jgi:ATP-binding cassette, subfamily B, bacterial
MKRWMRAGRLMLGIGWETGPPVFLAFLSVSLVSSLGPLLFAFALRSLTDGIYYRSTVSAVTGGILSAAALLIIGLAPYVERWAVPRIRERSIMVMQRRMLNLCAASPGLDHFERSDYWDRLQLIRRNFGDLLMGMANALTGPLILLQLVITAIALASIQPLLLILPLVGFPAAWLSQKAENLQRAGEQRAAEGRRAAQHLFSLASTAQSAKEIRVYDLRRELLSRHRETARGVQQVMERAWFGSVAVTATGWLIFGLAYVGAVLLALRAAAAGRMSPGDVALTLSLSTALVAAAGRLTQTAGLLLRAVTVADRYHWLADRVLPAHSTGRSDRTPAVPGRLITGIELENVSFAYPGSDRPALDHVNVSLDAGAVVAVVGENGAGKTTLVKLLSRMYAPSDGRILLDGTDIQRFDVNEYRLRLAAGFQDFARFEFVVQENVGVGDLPRLPDAGAVSQALARAGAGFTHRLPEGLETQLGRNWEGGVDLSGGEWQKLALARAMMRENPFLVIYDEPTAALDAPTEYALFEQIAADMRQGAAHGRITLLVSHRFSTVRMADLIVVLRNGRLTEYGTHGSLMAQGGLYAELYRLQARAYSSLSE